MAISKIKATYSLDVETTRQLERVAKRWNVSKSEALARAIRAAADGTSDDPIAALDTLQQQLRADSSALIEWAVGIRSERHAGASKREPR